MEDQEDVWTPWFSRNDRLHIVVAMMRYQMRAQNEGLSDLRPRSLKHMHEIVREWYTDSEFYGRKWLFRQIRLPIRYSWGWPCLNQLTAALMLEQDQESDEADVVDDSREQRLVTNLRTSKVLEDAGNGGFIVHGCWRTFPSKNGMLNMMIAVTRACLQTRSDPLITLTYPSLSGRYPNIANVAVMWTAAHLLRCFCQKVLKESEYARGLELGFVTNELLGVIERGVEASNANLCQVFREIVINIALLIAEHNKGTSDDHSHHQ